MDAKPAIEEKRIKSTIIRRRAKAEVAPSPVIVEETSLSTNQKIDSSVNQQEVHPPSELKEVSSAAPTETTITTGAPVAGSEGELEVVKEDPLKDKARKPARRKTRDELEMEIIERAGGLRKAAEIMVTSPERLDRVFRPEKSSKKKKVLTRKEFKKTELTTPKAIKRVIRMEGAIGVADLAHRMGAKSGEVIKKLMSLGVMATLNQVIDSDTALLIAQDFGYEVENVSFVEEDVFKKVSVAAEEINQQPRPPIVTIMGHVDHGKTTLLDTIRKAQVAEGEAGGMTQHIGAYEVLLPKGSITFVDTPGHEAFTAMRARGAQVTDIVILVVAADDGLMPQTVEAINHAKSAKVPIIVAVNKIDKPEADIARVERGLMEQQLVSEKFGGDTIMVPLSAKTGQGVDHLLEMILLQAEVLELKANPEKKAVGTIIEARLDKGRGPVATVIVQNGTLKVGDIIVAGCAYGKVRALVDDHGQNVKEAPPSKPVEVLGLSKMPMAGDALHVTDSEEEASTVAEHREKKIKESQVHLEGPARLEDLYARAAKGEVPELKLILKSDVQGSVEALKEVIFKLSSEKVRVSLLHGGVGAINESDVMLAIASKAVIIGFNIRPDANARKLAESEKIQIRTYTIIYDIAEDVKKAMEGLLKPRYEERFLGRAEVRETFSISKTGTIAGTFVTEGKIIRTASMRVIRDGAVLYQAKIASLKRFKEDAREVSSGLECGIRVENFNDVKVGDVLEAFAVEEIAETL